jgi:hypothetical protein
MFTWIGATSEQKSLIALALALTSVRGSSSSQAQSEKTPSLTESLSPVEILQRSDSLRLSIRLDPETVDVGQTPAIVTRFENVRPTDLYVNPHLVTGGFLPDLDQPARCVNANADYGIQRRIAAAYRRESSGRLRGARSASGGDCALASTCEIARLNALATSARSSTPRASRSSKAKTHSLCSGGCRFCLDGAVVRKLLRVTVTLTARNDKTHLVCRRA